MGIIESIYYLGVIVTLFVLIIDYIQLNLKVGYPLGPIIQSIFQVENLIMFVGFSLGSWLTLFMFIFNDFIDGFKN
jgi:hypothetical protein